MTLDHAQIEALLPYLTDAERNEISDIIQSLNRVWLPLPGPQLMASTSKADVVGFGGAAGGGKSDWLLGTALTQHKRSAIFRRTATQMPGIVQRMTDLLGSRDGYNGQDKIWRIPGSDKVVELCSCPNAGDEKNYQGRPKDFLGLDETANFLESQVRFLMGWVRTTDPNQHCQTGMAFNPPTSAEGRWIVDFFGPWIDDKHPAPAMPGELRWFAMLDGKEVELPGNERFHHKGELILPQSRTFIPSRIGDNPFLVATGYMATLQSFPEPLRSQMLYGDFLAGVMDDAYQVIPTEWVDIAMRRWQHPGVLPPMDSMGVDVARGGADRTVIARRHGWWFDRPLTYPGKATPDGHEVSAKVLTNRRDDAVIHIDVIGVGASPYDILSPVAQTVGVNASERANGPDKTGRLRFPNIRSQMWWRLRELLDPEANNNIALPQDPELLKELCAPTWRYTDSGEIRVEKREDIVKRLGYSPDLATAYVQAAFETPKRKAVGLDRSPTSNRRGYDPLAIAR